MVIGFPAGSSSDVVGRLVAQKMSDGLGQQVVFENRPGAGGNIGAEFIAKSPADGYSLLYPNTGLAVAVSAYKKLGYDAVRDLTPVGQAVAGPRLLISQSRASRAIRERFNRACESKTARLQRRIVGERQLRPFRIPNCFAR